MQGKEGGLKRVLSFWDVLFIAVGQTIGAGVIALTGVAIGMTGPGVVLAYLGPALLVLIASVLFMFAGSALPSTGAFYVRPSRLGNGWMGSFVLSLVLLASITLSLYGDSFGLYLHPIFPFLSVTGWGVVVITVAFLANLFGLKLASRIQMLLVILLVSALALYAGFAVPHLDPARLHPLFPKGLLGFLTAVFLLKFATAGSYTIVALGGEMRNPKRDIPLVMVVSTAGVALLYALIALASVGVIPWEEMINQPLTLAGKSFLPGWALVYFLFAGAGLAIATTVNAQFIQLPRNFIVASWDHLIPAWMGKTNRHGAPYFILLAMLAVGVVPLVAGLEIEAIALAATIASILPAFLIYWVVTRIPKRFPEQYERSLFKIGPFWLWLLFGLSELIMFSGVVLLSHGLSRQVLVTLAGWILVSVAYYPLRRGFLKRRGFDLDASATDPAVLDGAPLDPRGAVGEGRPGNVGQGLPGDEIRSRADS